MEEPKPALSPKCPICQAQSATRIRRTPVERIMALVRDRRKWECDVCGHLFWTRR
jgi:uncharacterized protein with PIN domain